MKAGWFFCTTSYDPVALELHPNWPGGVNPGVNVGAVYDVRRLQVLNAHRHIVFGTEGRISDDIRATDPHEHDVQYYNGAWRQFTRYGISAEHDHPFLFGGVGDIRFLPEYFLLFVQPSDDVAFQTLVDALPNWALAAEAPVTLVDGQYVVGDLSDSAGDFDRPTWVARFSAVFDYDIPVQVTTPLRFVSWFAPLCAPNMYDWWDEKYWR